jgi:hypothetical protein
MRSGTLAAPVIAHEGPEPRVRLAVTVRAEQNTLREFCLGLLLAAGDPVVRDGEVLRSGIEVMKFEQRLGEHTGTTGAEAAQQRDRSALRFASRSNDGVISGSLEAEVSTSMAIGADQVTLRGLRPDPLWFRANAAQGEGLRSAVAMMELERRCGPVITAVRARVAAGGQQLGAKSSACLLLIAICLHVSLLPPQLCEVGRAERASRRACRVVLSKW